MLVVRADGFVDPCIPTRATKAPAREGWVHEIKHDGYRLIVRRDGETVRLFTRRGYDWTGRYPAIASTAAKIRAQSFTLDGEAVVCGEDGVAIFDALHRHGTVRAAILQAFDLLEFNGEDKRPVMLGERKALLTRLLARGGRRHGVPARLHDGLGGDRIEATDSAVQVRTVEGLD
jgi:bifunctional non-homologous end joining protein LigD